MSKQNSSGQDFTSNSDGWDLTAGTTPRKLTVTGADVTLTGSGSSVFSFPGSTDTLVGRASVDALSNKTLTLAAGSTSIAPLVYTSGTNLTNPVAGATEFDGENFYGSIDTSSGRGTIPVEQYFHLTAAGSTISTIANYFGSNSNISLVANGYYEIEIVFFYLKTTAGTATWTLTNSSAPTSQNMYYEMSPVTGIVAPPGNASMLCGQIYNDTTANFGMATSSLTTGVNHYAKFLIWLKNGSGTSLTIKATAGAGTITPGIGSYWRCRRMPSGNAGVFVA